MDYTRQVGKVINFIEENLTCSFSLEDIADIANFSMFHFHRMFHSVTGLTPKCYIRRRRLSRAARELTFTTDPIAEIALKYQFESQAAFTRAFKKQFGITPGKLRRTKAAFNCFPAVDLQYKLKKGDMKMEVRILEKEDLKIIGMKVVTTQKNNTIPQLWDKFNARWSEVKNIAVHNACLGVCLPVEMKDFDENTEFSYVAGMIVENFDHIPEGMLSLKVPGHKYAVVTHKGALDTLPETYNYVYSQWLKNSDYEFCPAPELEWYDERFKFGEPDSEFDIFVPIK